MENTISNVGKWDRWYCGIDEPSPYGLTETYEMGNEWLKDCSIVEDWGCGKGWFKTIFKGNYIGIDGSYTPYSDKVVDLVQYKSDVPGIFMRHVLEHNYQWKQILINALNSFKERMVLIIFTPFAKAVTEIAYNDDIGVPDISLSLDELMPLFYDNKVFISEVITKNTKTQYEEETVFFLYKKHI